MDSAAAAADPLLSCWLASSPDLAAVEQLDLNCTSVSSSRSSTSLPPNEMTDPASRSLTFERGSPDPRPMSRPFNYNNINNRFLIRCLLVVPSGSYVSLYLRILQDDKSRSWWPCYQESIPFPLFVLACTLLAPDSAKVPALLGG